MNDINSFRGFRNNSLIEDPLDTISNKLDGITELQAATEMVAEVVEEKGNDVIDAISDDTAANELTAENTEKTVSELQKLNDFSVKMNDKLKSFSSMMEKKFSAIPKIQDGVTAIENVLSVPEQPVPQTMPSPEPLLPDVIRPPVPAPVVIPPTPTDDNNKKDKPREERPSQDNDKKKKKGGDNDALLNAIKGGFKQTVAVSDRILATLFKLTLTAAAEFVKWGAILMGIIFSIDVVATTVKYWFAQFDKNFSGFLETAGDWKKTLTNIFSSYEAVKDFFVNGDYVEALKTGFIASVNVVVDAINALDIAIGELGVKILRAFKMNDRADQMQFNVIERKMQLGLGLDENEKTLYARVKTEREREQLKEDVEGSSGILGFGARPGKKDEELTSRQREIKSVSSDQQMKSSMAATGARAEISGYSRVLERMYPSPKNKEKIDTLRVKVEDAKKKFDSSPDVLNSDRKEINDLYNSFMELYNSKSASSKPVSSNVSAPRASESEQAAQVNRVEQAKIELTTPVQPQTTTANVNNTQIVTNNRTIRQGAPQTSTAAPGLIQTGVV